VRSPKRAVLGRVTGVLFHPSEPRVVGLEVTPPRYFGVVRRRVRYVPFSSVAVREGALAIEDRSLPSNAAGQRVLGYSWDETVRWRGMPVRDSDGAAAGAVADATFDGQGVLDVLRISTGIAGDVAVGKLTVPAGDVEGFDGVAVVITARSRDLPSDGGAAKAVAKAAAVAKERGGVAARAASDATVRAAGAVGRSLHSGKARRVLDGLRRAMRDDDEGK
jgi:hypothetical protein